MFFILYDVAVEDGKAKGCGSRTLYPQGMPFCMAASHILHEPLVLEKHTTDLWDQLFSTDGE